MYLFLYLDKGFLQALFSDLFKNDGWLFFGKPIKLVVFSSTGGHKYGNFIVI